jgi:uncharacterized membrane protein
MGYETLNCNQCGALIQVPITARYVTCNRCGAHLVVQRTGVATYTEAAPRPAAAGEADPGWREMSGRLEYLEYQNELARIDREWDLERESYMVRGRYGARYVPNAVAAVVMGVIAAGFGIFWTVMAFGIAGGAGGLGAIFPLFGVVFIAAGVGMSIYQFNKAQQYQSALAAYQRRRADVEDQLRGRYDGGRIDGPRDAYEQ